MTVAVVFVSVLVHEMGHAMAMRRLGARPSITLYGMGGLTDPCGMQFSSVMQILVTLAGPMAGFALAGLVVAAIKLSHHQVEFAFGFPWLIEWRFGSFERLAVADLCNRLLYVNIWWGILNLLPIFPLDGGRIVREVLNLTYPRAALVLTLQISLIAATIVVATGFATRPFDWFRILLFGSLIYTNWQMLSSLTGSRRG